MTAGWKQRIPSAPLNTQHTGGLPPRLAYSWKRTVVDERFGGEREARQGFPLPGMVKTPIVTWALLSANVVIWLVATAAGGTEDPEVLLNFGATFGPLIARGEYWRLFTAMFLHVGPVHLLFNSFALFVFGRLAERVFGHFRFLTVYILSGLSGSVASYLLGSIAIGAGASGAIFGVLGALVAFFAAQREAFGAVAWQNLTGLLLLAAINLAFGFAVPGIDNWAHMGGFAAGTVLGLALAPRYGLVKSPFGTPMSMVRTALLMRKWWVVPAVLSLLLMGVWMATVTLPDNPYSRVYRAESYFMQEEYEAAFDELEQAIRLNETMAEAYLLRGRIFVALGDKARARADAAMALRFGDSAIKEEAIALLVAMDSLR